MDGWVGPHSGGWPVGRFFFSAENVVNWLLQYFYLCLTFIILL